MTKTETSLSFQDVVKLIFEEECRESNSITPHFNLNSTANLTNKPEYPSLVQIGISNVCNLRCQQCAYPQLVKQPNYKPILMSGEIFHRVIEETKGFPATTVLRFLGRGETFIHPKWETYLSDAKKRLEGPVAVITNGHLVDEKRAGKLLDTEIDVVDFSIDALTPETYAKVRYGNFDKLTKNVSEFVELRNRLESKTRILVSFLLQPENYKEALDFRTRWKGVVDKIIFRKYHSYAGKIAEKGCDGENLSRHPCAALWSRVNINESGRITLCYIDWDETTVLSDLNNPNVTILETFREIMQPARRQHLTQQDLPALCARCKTGWQAAHWNTLTYENAIYVAKK